MKITYDAEVDAVYIQLIDGQPQSRTLRLTEEIALNIGADEVLVGIEVLDARAILGHGQTPKLIVENLTPTAA
jgi:uncharacterized protein YuzE